MDTGDAGSGVAEAGVGDADLGEAGVCRAGGGVIVCTSAAFGWPQRSRPGGSRLRSPGGGAHPRRTSDPALRPPTVRSPCRLLESSPATADWSGGRPGNGPAQTFHADGMAGKSPLILRSRMPCGTRAHVGLRLGGGVPGVVRVAARACRGTLLEGARGPQYSSPISLLERHRRRGRPGPQIIRVGSRRSDCHIV